MRIVSEVPNKYSHARGKYPWEKIAEAVRNGSVVEMDPEDYDVSLAGLRSVANQARNYEDGRRWKVSQRSGKIYISPL